MCLLQLQEADIIENLEEMCDPDTEAGDWITAIDLQEKDDKLVLVEMGNVGGPWMPLMARMPPKWVSL